VLKWNICTGNENENERWRWKYQGVVKNENSTFVAK
jgi:hypothetical protein